MGLLTFAVLVLGAVGFTSAGISAGSSNCGGVADGSVAAVPQSADQCFIKDKYNTGSDDTEDPDKDNQGSDYTEADKEDLIKRICKAAVIGAGGVGAVVLTPAALAALGFTSTGIAAGTVAAKLMSFFAVGGATASGGLVATLQSLGATGLTGSGTGAVAGAGVSLGWLLSTICGVQEEQHA